MCRVFSIFILGIYGSWRDWIIFLGIFLASFGVIGGIRDVYLRDTNVRSRNLGKGRGGVEMLEKRVF